MWRAERQRERETAHVQTGRGIKRDRRGGRREWEVCGLWPLLAPSGPRRTVHSSIWPKVSKSRRTSSSLCCLPSIPTNSFLSSGWEERKGERRERGKEGRSVEERTDKCYSWWHRSAELNFYQQSAVLSLSCRCRCYCCWSYCCVVCHPALVWGRCIPVSSELFKSATGTFDRDDVRSAVGFRER